MGKIVVQYMMKRRLALFVAPTGYRRMICIFKDVVFRKRI